MAYIVIFRMSAVIRYEGVPCDTLEETLDHAAHARGVLKRMGYVVGKGEEEEHAWSACHSSERPDLLVRARSVGEGDGAV